MQFKNTDTSVNQSTKWCQLTCKFDNIIYKTFRIISYHSATHGINSKLVFPETLFKLKKQKKININVNIVNLLIICIIWLGNIQSILYTSHQLLSQYNLPHSPNVFHYAGVTVLLKTSTFNLSFVWPVAYSSAGCDLYGSIRTCCLWTCPTAYRRIVCRQWSRQIYWTPTINRFLPVVLFELVVISSKVLDATKNWNS